MTIFSGTSGELAQGSVQRSVMTATASAGLYSGKVGSGRSDLLLIAFPGGAEAAGLVTRSRTRSSAADWCAARLPQSGLRGVIVNAGNANAFTGPAGEDDTRRLAEFGADVLATDASHLLVASTGVIGEPLPMDRIRAAHSSLAADISPLDSLDRLEQAARAIMTTDTRSKVVRRTFDFKGQRREWVGFAKGSGMIRPDMATMLTFMITDAAIGAELLDGCLRAVAEETLHSLTVDGDTSTSDTCLLMATGRSMEDGSSATVGERQLGDFRDSLLDGLGELCREVARDGEGARRLVTIRVVGAESNDIARRVGRIVGESLLVKTALAAGDANWGRFVAAVGKAGCQLGCRVERERLRIIIAGKVLTQMGGRAAGYDEGPIAAHLAGNEVEIEIDLGVGKGRGRIWTCDLTEEYVRINGDYRS